PMAAGKRGAEVDTRFETDVDSALGRDPNRLRGIAILALTRPSPLTHHEATAPPARKLALRLGLALALIGGLAPAAAARAATIVPNTTFDETAAGGTCSLREAVQSSNTNTDVGGCTHTGTYGSDTILLAGGDYDLTLKGAPEDSNANGELEVAASLTIVGLGADQTGIDGSGAITGDRVLDALGFEASLSLFGVAIHGGNVTGVGGGIRAAVGTTLNLTGSTVSGNTATDSGGGILAGTANLTNSTVSGNATGGFGGGIGATTANLTNTTVTGNTASPFG